MQFRQQPQSTQCKIAILIIALVGDVSCIKNGGNGNNDGNDAPISAKLKNFFPSEQFNELDEAKLMPQTAARQSDNYGGGGGGGNGFRPSQMLEFTPSDATQLGANRYPPSYLAPNYKRQLPSSQSQPQAMDKQFSFPNEEPARPASVYHSYASPSSSTPLSTTPVVSYVDPYRYQSTSTSPSYVQYQREQPEGDQAYTVQSSLLVGSQQHSHSSPQQTRPGIVEDVYLKRPGYVFDERPSSSSSSVLYRRPSATPTTPAPAHKISYDSHDYPPPSYAEQQTSNFVSLPSRRPPTTPPPPPPPSYSQLQSSIQHRPPYHRQDVNDNRPLAASSIQAAAFAPSYSSSSLPSSSSANYANNFGNYLQRPPATLQGGGSQFSQRPAHYQYEPLQRPQHQQQQQQQQQPGHNYYEYQIGEIPPQQQQQQFQHQHQPQYQQPFNYPAPGYRPPYQQQQQHQPPPTQASGGGLATLASLFSSTQQYAPQFTNLLLAGVGAGGGGSSASSNSPLGSLLGAFTGAGAPSAGSGGHNGAQHAPQRLPNTQLIRALENIARNDDLQCVPKVLCQMIAGQTLRGQLPGFITSPAITNFLAGFPAASPALIYGRAALLGISGGDRSCMQTYAQCPKNEMEIIHYLNNHRGGFFKFFSEPEEQPVADQQSGGGGGGSLFSILSALTGGGGGGQTYTTPRPRPPPPPRPTQSPTTDIANGIGSFFTRVLSEYLNGVEYQRRRRRRSLTAEIKRDFQPDGLMPVDFHDAEDDLDTQTPIRFQDDDEVEDEKAHTELIGVLQFPEHENESRILHHKDIASEEEEQQQHNAVRFPDAQQEEQRQSEQNVIYNFNRDAAKRKLRFPREQLESESKLEGWRAVVPNELTIEDYGVDKRRGKRIVFKDTNVEPEEPYPVNEELLREEPLNDVYEQSEPQAPLNAVYEQSEPQAPLNAVYEQAAPPQRGARVIFPDHYERYIRRGKILTRPTYAPSYEYNREEEQLGNRLVVSDTHRQQPPGAYYRLETSVENQNYATQSQSFMNLGEYMPTGQVSTGSNTVRFAEDESRPSYSAHYNYPNANYVSDNRYSSSYQATSTRRPKHEDDKNIYINNEHGVTEYYIRPDGRKIFLG